MKKNSILLFILISVCSFSQNDTIFISPSISSQLIFPESIESVDVSSKDFCMTSEAAENILIIQAKGVASKFVKSTLLVKTIDKIYYKFLIEFSNSPKQTTFFIRKENSLNHSKEKYLLNYQGDKQEAIPVVKPKKGTVDNKQLTSIYSKEIEAIFNDKCVLKKAKLIKDKVKFQLCNNYSKANKSYYKFYIKNNAFLEYNIKYFKLKVETKKDKNNKSSVTKEYIKKDFKIYGDINQTIKNKDKVYFVIELEKLVVHENEYFTIEIKEDLGNRDFKFYVPRYLVNDPYPIKDK